MHADRKNSNKRKITIVPIPIEAINQSISQSFRVKQSKTLCNFIINATNCACAKTATEKNGQNVKMELDHVIDTVNLQSTEFSHSAFESTAFWSLVPIWSRYNANHSIFD